MVLYIFSIIKADIISEEYVIRQIQNVGNRNGFYGGSTPAQFVLTTAYAFGKLLGYKEDNIMKFYYYSDHNLDRYHYDKKMFNPIITRLMATEFYKRKYEELISHIQDVPQI